jgi:hypothetical protein
MASTISPRAYSLVVLAAAAFMPLAVVTGACGGGQKTATNTPTPSASDAPGSSDTGSAAAATSASAPAVSGSTAVVAPPPVPTSKKATKKNDATWATCHQSFQAKAKDVSKDVTAMAKGCAAATKMKVVGKTLTGKQTDQQAPQSYPLDAKANHCYRAYAQAADGIKDLDLVIKDGDGIAAGEDSTDDPSPVVLEDGAVCFSVDDPKATVVVSVGMGGGNYAVEIWSD